MLSSYMLRHLNAHMLDRRLAAAKALHPPWLGISALDPELEQAAAQAPSP